MPSPKPRARKTEIIFLRDNYGVVEFNAEAADELPASDRFGVGVSPFNGDDGDDGEPGTGTCKCEGASGLPIIYEDTLTSDTDSSATLEAWTDLPGLSRTISVQRPSVAYVTAHVVVQCADEGGVEDAECRVRILVNGLEGSGHSRVSFTPAYLKLPGRSVKSVRTIPIQCTFRLRANTAYTYKVQISNFTEATTYTALRGTSSEPHSNMMMILFQGVQGDDGGTGSGGGPGGPQAVEGNDWVKILDFAYDEFHDEIAVARVRGNWDDAVPEVAGDLSTGPWTETPDRAFVEVAYYSRAGLQTINPTSTLGGTVRYKRQLSDPSIWMDLYSVAFNVSTQSGAVAWVYSASEAGPTAYSQVFYLVITSYGGREYAYESWNGPNWYNDASPYYTTGLYGAAAWGGPEDDAYLLVPTTDTTAKSSTSPYKSGWRIWVRNGIGTTYSGLTKGAEQSSDDITPGGGHLAVAPITLTIQGSDIRYWRYEIYTLLDRRIETDLLVSPGGFVQHELGGYIPATGEALKPSWNMTVPASYIFSRQGYYDIYEESSGGTSNPNDLTLINDDYYNQDPPVYDPNKIALYDAGADILLFSRGIQGGGVMYRDPGGGMDVQTAAWLVFAPDES